ncbi:MAG: glycosyltransferase family 92 protein, partial [Gammaproteobacteria bacterium]
MASYYLAVCAIFRDEAPYLREWISFHKLMGVEHFYLYNNSSVDKFENILAPFIDKGDVTLTSWPIPFHQKAQKQAYIHCLDQIRGQVRWLACIDIDEFLFAPNNDNLPTVLAEYESYPGVIAHWQVYGSNDLKQMTDEPVIARFTRRAPSNWIRNRKAKSIVDPERTIEPTGVHYFLYTDGELAVDETHAKVKLKSRKRYAKFLKRIFRKLGLLQRYVDPYSPQDTNSSLVSVEKLRINHYPVKSYEEYLKK